MQDELLRHQEDSIREGGVDRAARDVGEGREESLNQTQHCQLGGLGSMVGSPSLGVVDSRTEGSKRRMATDTPALQIRRLHLPPLVHPMPIPLVVQQLALPPLLRQLRLPRAKCRASCPTQIRSWFEASCSRWSGPASGCLRCVWRGVWI